MPFGGLGMLAAGAMSLGGGLAGLFGGTPASQVQSPPAWQAPNMTGAANSALSGIGGLGQYNTYNIPQYSGITQAAINDPNAAQYQGAANFASNLGMNTALANYGTGGNIQNIGQGQVGTGQGLGGLANVAANPGGSVFPMAGAAGNMANSIYNMGSNLAPVAGGAFGAAPWFMNQGNAAAAQAQPLFNQSGQAFGAGASILPYMNPVLASGFDPQNALYNRTAQQVQDQTRAAEAARGVATTPYGAGVEGQTMSNFNIDWQNQQLARQAQAAGAASGILGAGMGAFGTGGQLAGQGGNLMNTAGGLYGQGVGALNTGANIMNTAGGLQNMGLSGLNTAAGITGQGVSDIATGANIYGTGSGIQNAGVANMMAGAGLMGAQPGAFLAAGGMPYAASQGVSGNQLALLSGLGAFGNQAATLPGQQISDYMNYLNMGNQANQVQNNLYANQIAQAKAVSDQQQAMAKGIGGGLAQIGQGLGPKGLNIGNPFGSWTGTPT